MENKNLEPDFCDEDFSDELAYEDLANQEFDNDISESLKKRDESWTLVYSGIQRGYFSYSFNHFCIIITSGIAIETMDMINAIMEMIVGMQNLIISLLW